MENNGINNLGEVVYTTREETMCNFAAIDHEEILIAEIRRDVINTIAENVVGDAIVTTDKYITVPGNNFENYVEIMIAADVDTTDLTPEEINLLKNLLIEAAKKQIAENR